MGSVRKIIVDSRSFLNNAPAGNGVFELPESLDIFQNEFLYLQSFHCMASWLSVDATNNTMFIIEYGVNTTARTIRIPDAAYDADSLAAELQSSLNAPGKSIRGVYSVTRVDSASPDVIVSASATARLYTITLSDQAGQMLEEFFIPDDSFLKDIVFYTNTWLPAGGPTYDLANPPSTNELFSFPGDFVGSSQTSTFVDLRSKHALFLHSTTFGEMSSMGASNAMRTCFAVVPITVGYGQMVVYQGSGNPHDFIPAGTRSLRRLALEVRSSSGDIIDFQGGRYIAVFVVGTKP